MNNDVVMVAIPKELRDSLMGLLETEPTGRFYEALRAAPETVSLEGVEPVGWTWEWTHKREGKRTRVTKQENPNADKEWEDDCKAGGCTMPEPVYALSDLRRLVTPVQPSAVVSRDATDEEILKHLKSVGYVSDVGLNDILKLARALQLPQPVAPIQSGGVCGWFEAGTLLRASCDFQHRGHGNRPDVCLYCRKPTVFTEGRLTTTQSAPSVPSDSMIRALEAIAWLKEWIGPSQHGASKALAQIEYIDMVFDLLPVRQGAKP